MKIREKLDILYAVIIALLASTAGFAYAQATTTIELPSGFVAGILAQVNALFTSFSSLIYTIMGILLGLLVLQIIMNTLGRR